MCAIQDFITAGGESDTINKLHECAQKAAEGIEEAQLNENVENVDKVDKQKPVSDTEEYQIKEGKITVTLPEKIRCKWWNRD